MILFSLQVIIAPPLYRSKPSWYQSGLAQIASRFSLTLTALRPANLLLLPSFVSQDLMPDGHHLTPVSGLHYVLHVFDQVEVLLALDHHGPDAKLGHFQETVRQHDDRLSYLESRHGGLQGRVDLKLASDAEFQDWTINRSEEDWLTVLGLPRLGNMLPREWQVAAKKQVKELIRLVLHVNRVNLDFTILFVGNPLRYRTSGQTVYNVRLDSAVASQRIRDLYSGFFRHDRPVQLPERLKGVSIKNKVTLATRVRVRIMQELASNYQTSNPGSVAKVQGFISRPILMINHPRGSSERPQSYHFVEAVTKLKAVLSDDSLAKIFQVIGTRHQGELQSLFVILSDDDRHRCEELAKNYSRGPRSRALPSGPTSSSATASGFVSGSGDGVGLEANFLESIRRAPPPPPTETVRETPRARDRSPSPSSSPRREVRFKEKKSDKSEKHGKRSRRSSSSSSASSRGASHKKAKSKKSKRSHRSRSASSSSSASTESRSSKRKSRK